MKVLGGIPVSFWCSKCHFDHPGECQPARSSVLYPSIGTKWKAVPVPGSPQEALRAIGKNIFEVIDFDAAESNSVHVRSIANGRNHTIQIQAWHDPKGGKCLEGPQDWFWKMVPA